MGRVVYWGMLGRPGGAQGQYLCVLRSDSGQYSRSTICGKNQTKVSNIGLDFNKELPEVNKRRHHGIL